MNIEDNPPLNRRTLDHAIKGDHIQEVKILSHGQFMTPGFIDGHTHAVQFPNLGLGYDKHLLDWLEIYTFPLEKEYADTKFAERVFDTVVVLNNIQDAYYRMYNQLRCSHNFSSNMYTTAETDHQYGHNNGMLLCIFIY